MRLRHVAALVIASTLVSPALSATSSPREYALAAPAPNGKPTIAQFLKPGLPLELVSAKNADRIAWLSYEEGRRNVFTAVAPASNALRNSRSEARSHLHPLRAS